MAFLRVYSPGIAEGYFYEETMCKSLNCVN